MEQRDRTVKISPRTDVRAVCAHFTAAALVAALLLLACGGGDDEAKGSKLDGTTAIERYTSLARAKGCTLPTTFPALTAACEALMLAWVDCVATDLTQCLCEPDDGSLNCEGSFKANEGPALCVTEMNAFQAAGCDPN